VKTTTGRRAERQHRALFAERLQGKAEAHCLCLLQSGDPRAGFAALKALELPLRAPCADR